MNILVTGANGLLGSSVMTELRRRGHHGIAVGRAPQCRSTDAAAYVQTDLCDASAVQALFAGVQPDAVIHCAAWTDVDGAELPENREQVLALPMLVCWASDSGNPRAGVCRQPGQHAKRG